MYVTNKLLIDSLIFIEALEGNKVSFYGDLILEGQNEFFINEIILSEYLYLLIDYNGGTSPRTLKERRAMQTILNKPLSELDFLNDLIILPSSNIVRWLVPKFMSAYNLVPNDAIILTTCKIHSTQKLAWHDVDFNPCALQGIELLREDQFFGQASNVNHAFVAQNNASATDVSLS